MDRAELCAKWKRLRDPIPRPGREELPFPTEAQLDLLKAALLPAAAAAPAWRRWKARGLELETVERDSIRMFPQLWTNRDAAAVGADDVPILKGVYRHVLAKNAGALTAALDANQLLTQAGIPVLFIKGAAVVARTGRLGLRLMDDVDFLIPEVDAQRAIAVLTTAGYQDKKIGADHSWDCISPTGYPLDVHWWAFKIAGDDRCMFESACGGALLGEAVLIPSATESLMAAIAHGFRSQGGSPMRWIADAYLLLEMQDEAIDWSVLLERARRPGLTTSLFAGLEFLAREFGSPVPVEVLDQLRRRPVHWRERAAHWAEVGHRPVGANLARDLLESRARRLHYGDLSRWDHVGQDFRAVRVEVRRTVRWVLVELIRCFDAAASVTRGTRQLPERRE